MKKFCLLFIASLLGISAYGRQISESEARAIASARLSGCGEVPVRVKSNVTNSDDAYSPLYMFNAKGGGFAIIAGDDSMPNMVLAYSETGTLDLDNCSPAMRAWLDEMSAFITAGDLSKIRRISQDYSNPVSPLVKTKWDQSEPYNMLTPEATSGKHCLTGCAATAMAQIINYWQYPKEGGLCEHSYEWNGKTLGVDFRESRYDWDNMANEYGTDATEAQKNAVAKLMYDCGVAVNMDYGETVSNANAPNCALGIVDMFGYSKTLRLRMRDTSTADEWYGIVKGELDAARPLLYLGCTESNEGHAFVCDGYDSEGMFHINWGWGGFNDGYYDLDTLDPEGQGAGGAASGQGFSTSQMILTGLQPPQEDDQAAEGWEMAVYSYFTEPLDAEGNKFNMQIMLLNNGYRPFAGNICQTMYKDGEIVPDEKEEILGEVTEDEAIAPGEVYKIALDNIDAASLQDGKWSFDLLAADHNTPSILRVISLHNTASPMEFEIKDGKLVYDPRPVIMIDDYDCEDLDIYVTAMDGVRSKFSKLTLTLKNNSGITYKNGVTIKLAYKNGVMMDMTQRAIHFYEPLTIEPGESVEIECPIYYNVASQVKVSVEENPVGENETQEALFKKNEISFMSNDVYHELIFTDEPSYEESEGKVTFTVPVASCMGNPSSSDPDYEYEMERSIECVVLDSTQQTIVASDTQTYSGKWHEAKEFTFTPQQTLENGSYIVAFIYKSMPNLMGETLDLNLGIEEGVEGFPITISTSGIDALGADTDNERIEIYSINGARMADRFSLTPGIYICRKGDSVSKIIVR